MFNILKRSPLLPIGCALAWAGPVLAQANVAVQYTFQDAAGTGTTVPTVNNTGVVLDATASALLGGTTATFASGAGSTDPAATNLAWDTTDYPAAGAGNGTAGVRFRLPTT